MFDEDFWKAITTMCAFVCITYIAYELKNADVLWWYLIPAFMYTT